MLENFQLINAWSITSSRSPLGDRGDVILIGIQDGKRVVKRVKKNWYFLTDATVTSDRILTKLKDSGNILGFKKDGQYTKVFMAKGGFRDETAINVVKLLEGEGLKTYEADLGPAKRFIIDAGLEMAPFDKVNVLFFDIETDDSVGRIEYFFGKDGVQRVKANSRVLSFAGVTKDGKEYFLTDKDEKKLLNKINDLIIGEKIDMLVGWNSKDFDLPFLYQRMELHKIPSTYLRNVLHEDLMRRAQYFYMKDPTVRLELKSYALESVSQYFLKEGKAKREGKVIDLYRDDFEKFKEYNLQDCKLLKKLEEKLGLINLTYMMFAMCNCTAQNWSMVKAIDNLILTESNKRGIRMKTNENYYTETKQADEYLGAFVIKPVPGYYENVYDLDFKSLYPNIIRTFNISPDTYVDPLHAEEYGFGQLIHTPGTDANKGRAYYKKEQGVIPAKIGMLLEEREKIRAEQKKHEKGSAEWRDLNVKQLVVKELANSIYGVIGNRFFRGFNINMAESITGTGQYLIKHLSDRFGKKGRKVIYGDTDSLFVVLGRGEKIEDVLEETNTYLREHLIKTFGISNPTIVLALDKVLDKFFIEAKKKYVGLSGGKEVYVGMECIKGDTPKFVAHAQKELFKMFFEGKELPDMIEFIDRQMDICSPGKLPLDHIKVSKKMGKDADSYKGKSETKKYTAPLHVRLAKEEKDPELMKGGALIEYYIVDAREGLVGKLAKNGDGSDADFVYYWNQVHFPPLKRALEIKHSSYDWSSKFREYDEQCSPKRKTIRRLRVRSDKGEGSGPESVPVSRKRKHEQGEG